MQFKVYFEHEQKEETLRLKPTESGWYLTHPSCQGSCDPGGQPYLKRYIEENQSTYPPALIDALEEIWSAYQGGSLQREDMQERFNHFSEWLKAYQQDPTFKLSDF